MKTNEMRIIVIRGVLLVLLSLYFVVVFGQSSEVVSFHASRSDNEIALQWQLAEQNKLSTVVIERKASEEDFKPIAEFWVNFDGNKERNFSYADKKIKAKAFQYRLKLISQSGDVKYTDALVLNKGVDKSTLSSPSRAEDSDNETQQTKRAMLAESKASDNKNESGFRVLLKMKLKEKEDENNLL